MKLAVPNVWVTVGSPAPGVDEPPNGREAVISGRPLSGTTTMTSVYGIEPMDCMRVEVSETEPDVVVYVERLPLARLLKGRLTTTIRL